MAIKTYGTMAVDWERRIDFDRLRRERLDRIKGLLAKSEMGSVLCFDMNNVRYITATHIGTWAQDKISRFTLLPQNDEPILWDFGSAARHHQQNCDWLGERSRAGIPLMRGAMTPEMGRSEDVARKIKIELESRGLHKEPVGVDVVEPPMLFALQKEGLNIVDGQQLMSDAREIKTVDEISLLTHSAAMVDAAYYDLYRAMKPGMRENDAVALVAQRLYEMGSEYVEGVNAISAERASPHPHVFSDRMMRPGDPVFYDILHSYMGYRTCYYRCFAIGSASHQLVDAYKRCRDYLDASIELIRPGRSTAEVASVWPKATEFGFPDEEAAFALQMGHGIGLAIWEKPMISRLVSLEHPHEIKPGMVFALETFWPTKDGTSAARIEEEIVVTATGHEVITRFPAEELLVAGAPFVTVGGQLPLVRETEAPPNPEVAKMVAAAAKAEVPKGEKVGARSLMAISVVMPALEMAQETGKLVSWKKKEGEQVKKGEMLLEVETDKAVVEIEAGGDGMLAGVTAKVGDVVPVGQTIAWLLKPGEAVSDRWCPQRRADGRWSRHLRPLLLQPRPPLPSRRPLRARRFRRRRDGSRASTAWTSPGSEGPDRAARSSRTTSSRPRRPRADQRRFRAPAAQATPAPRLVLLRRRRGRGPADAVSSIGRIMAERTTQSWTTVPHFFVARDVDATALNATREGLIPVIEKSHGVKITHTDLMVSAVARALQASSRG